MRTLRLRHVAGAGADTVGRSQLLRSAAIGLARSHLMRMSLTYELYSYLIYILRGMGRGASFYTKFLGDHLFGIIVMACVAP